MDNIFAFFEKLLTNFTWSRLTFTLVIFILAVSAIIGFELYTFHFKLNRLAEEVKVLEQLVTISDRVSLDNKQQLIDNAFALTLSEYTSQFAKIQSSAQNSYWPLAALNNLPDWLSKSFYILLPWVILVIFFIFTMDSGKGSAIGGVMFIALTWLFIGIFLPRFSNPLIMQLWYPWGALAGTLTLILLMDRRNKRKAAMLTT